jgi:threonine/homoserine/homoserine lactone efflux protein
MQSPSFFLFLTTAVLMIATPGPDLIYIITRGITQGRQIALLSTVGVCAGYIVHTIFAVLGLSALVQSSAGVFEMIRYAGAAYLVYLGIRTLRSKQHLILKPAEVKPTKKSRIVWQGIITSVLNPKGILFFMAFLPQFVNPYVGRVVAQMFALGLTFTVLCFLIYGTVGYFAGSLGNRLAGHTKFADVLQWITGTVLVGLGLRLALPEHR